MSNDSTLKRETFWIGEGGVEEQINNILKFSNEPQTSGNKTCKIDVKGVIQEKDALVLLYYLEEV